MKGASEGRAVCAARAWQVLFDYLMATTPERNAELERRGLTPNDARGLFSLTPRRGRPIGELAREWGCDPSNATYIISRLERAGLAARRPDRDDRRVKLVRLTPRGLRTRANLLAEFRRAPHELLLLSNAELGTLERIFTQVLRVRRESTGGASP